MAEYGLSNPSFGPLGTNTTLFRLKAADMNSTSDQAFTPAFAFAQYIVKELVVSNASAPMTNAIGGVYTDPSKAGNAIVPASQPYSGLTLSNRVINPTIAPEGQEVMTDMSLWLSLTTPQGSPATADFYLMGIAG